MHMRLIKLITFLLLSFLVLNCDQDIIVVSSTDLPAEPAQFTDDGSVKYQPAWSNDGSRIVYVAEEQITRVSTQHSDEAPVFIGYFTGSKRDFTNIQLQHESRLLLCTTADNKQLVLHRLSQGETHIVEDGAEFMFPRWAHSGDQFVYVRHLDAGQKIILKNNALATLNSFILPTDFVIQHLQWGNDDQSLILWPEQTENAIMQLSIQNGSFTEIDSSEINTGSAEANATPANPSILLNDQTVARTWIVNVETKEKMRLHALDPTEFLLDTIPDEYWPNWEPDDNTIRLIRERGLEEYLDVNRIPLGKGSTESIPSHLLMKKGNLITPCFRAQLSADGTRYLYANNGSIFVENTTSGKLYDFSQKITEPLSEPVWFTDQQRVAAISKGENAVKLIYFDPEIDSLHITPIEIPNFTGSIEGQIRQIVFSNPHPILGTRLAFSYLQSIYLFYLNENKIEQVVANGSHPAFSPEGERLAFMQDNELRIIHLLFEFE